MNPVIVALAAKFILALALIIGGIFAIRFGFRLYISGVGLSTDGTTIELRNVKASLKTTGAVVMATSVAWGWFGYMSSPKFSDVTAGVTVAQEHWKPVDLSISSLEIPLPPNSADRTKLTSNDYLALCRKALAGGTIKLNGSDAILRDLSVASERGGVTLCSAKLASHSAVTTLTLKPDFTDGTLIKWLPSELSVSKSEMSAEWIKRLQELLKSHEELEKANPSPDEPKKSEHKAPEGEPQQNKSK